MKKNLFIANLNYEYSFEQKKELADFNNGIIHHLVNFYPQRAILSEKSGNVEAKIDFVNEVNSFSETMDRLFSIRHILYNAVFYINRNSFFDFGVEFFYLDSSEILTSKRFFSSKKGFHVHDSLRMDFVKRGLKGKDKAFLKLFSKIFNWSIQILPFFGSIPIKSFTWNRDGKAFMIMSDRLDFNDIIDGLESWINHEVVLGWKHSLLTCSNKRIFCSPSGFIDKKKIFQKEPLELKKIFFILKEDEKEKCSLNSTSELFQYPSLFFNYSKFKPIEALLNDRISSAIDDFPELEYSFIKKDAVKDLF